MTTFLISGFLNPPCFSSIYQNSRQSSYIFWYLWKFFLLPNFVTAIAWSNMWNKSMALSIVTVRPQSISQVFVCINTNVILYLQQLHIKKILNSNYGLHFLAKHVCSKCVKNPLVSKQNGSLKLPIQINKVGPVIYLHTSTAKMRL